MAPWSERGDGLGGSDGQTAPFVRTFPRLRLAGFAFATVLVSTLFHSHQRHERRHRQQRDAAPTFLARPRGLIEHAPCVVSGPTRKGRLYVLYVHIDDLSDGLLDVCRLEYHRTGEWRRLDKWSGEPDILVEGAGRRSVPVRY